MAEQLINLADIIADPALQPRERMDPATVLEYQAEMEAGAQFPPVIAFSDDAGKFWLADGFHRVQAGKQAGHSVINADVRPGGRREALLYSVSANATHGLRRSNADKRRAVLTLLRDTEWQGWSDHEIGRQCAVSAMFVGNLRRELAAEIGPRPEAVTARRGETVYSVKLPEKQPTPQTAPAMRAELTRSLPEQITMEPKPAQPIPAMTPTASIPHKLEMHPVASEGRDVIATLRIRPGDELSDRAITVTVSEEFGLGKWATGVYADWPQLMNELLAQHFGG